MASGQTRGAGGQCSAFFFTWWCLICYVSFRQLSGCVRGLDRLVGLGRRSGGRRHPPFAVRARVAMDGSLQSLQLCRANTTRVLEK